MYALPFVFANFGIAIAARMPMMTTTINSSISVNPFRVIGTLLGWLQVQPDPIKASHEPPWPDFASDSGSGRYVTRHTFHNNLQRRVLQRISQPASRGSGIS